MTSDLIRKTFLEFFKNRGHEIVPSAPMVIKNDPTLMFTNAGMNQFKDIILGNVQPKSRRVADTQKCLRVSGKHNDLEEVGVDTYHHTMFEMLGNWSFGDYFKKDAIEWAWKLLTDVYKIPKDILYVTVFEGDAKENLAFDQEAYDYWKQWIAEDRILKGNKKDNFWEMGETGPCGPCSEIHVDIRSKEERKRVDGKTLVNESHPQVIEIWNNVFMEFNRKADGSLEPLPAKHVDTGMGFERLCVVLQEKTSNYDTDVFQPMIQFMAAQSNIKYGADEKTDIAMRVMADHIRAISFAIADGQLPSNNKAGYVIRRILRRAVRYGFTFLNFKEPFINKLVPMLADQFKEVFPELYSQKDFVQKVVHEEEVSFLRTLENGIRLFEEHEMIKSTPVLNRAEDEDFFKKYSTYIHGDAIFKLYDTFGFPVDLIQLMAKEKNILLDIDGFNNLLALQKERSRAAAAVDTEDWVSVKDEDAVEFVGYDELQCEAEIVKYRKVKSKGKEQYQIVLNKTPFYAESGGQVGDTGVLSNEKEKITITDTQKENNLIIHFVNKLPADVAAKFTATVDRDRRKEITSNHSATHLMHAALRAVLGKHVAQKGSLVNESLTRFDFSHFTKVTDEELAQIEKMVNEKIRENILLNERRNVPIAEAKNLGAMALFGEKYGDFVRVITFDKDYSVELCGGTHVNATGQIGLFKIVSESSVAAGVRRVEAITSIEAENYVNERLKTFEQLKVLLNNPKDAVKGLQQLLDDNQKAKKEIENFLWQKTAALKTGLLASMKTINGLHVIIEKIDLPSAEAIKNLSFDLKKETDNLFLLLAAEVDGKAHLSLIISDSLVADKKLDAKKIIGKLSKEIQGGGGGQSFYATAGGKNVNGIQTALEKGKTFIEGGKSYLIYN